MLGTNVQKTDPTLVLSPEQRLALIQAKLERAEQESQDLKKLANESGLFRKLLDKRR